MDREGTIKAIHDGLSTRAMALKFGLSQSGMMYRLKKYNLNIPTERCVLWSVPNSDEFIRVVKKCISFSDVLRTFGFKPEGHNLQVVKKRAKRLSIDCSHMKRYGKVNGRKWGPAPIELEELLIKNCKHERKWIKKKLIDSGILKNECSECGQGPEWREKKLILVLDHINGLNDDYRRKNLRLLCPNCNSQTPTFSRRKFKK